MKKTLILLSLLAFTLLLCFSASAQEDDWYLGSDHGCKETIIDNVRYRLITDKTYGEHYAVIDFIHDETLAETTTKINIVDEIEGVEVLGIKTNYDDSPDLPSPAYTNKYPSVKKVSIPDNVKYIGFYAFNCFPSVEKLYLPEDLISIGVGAFYGMETLKNITIPSGISMIADRAFKDCKSLTKVVLSQNIKHIGVSAFSGCESLTIINFPASLILIDDNAFDHTAFTKIVIPENIKLFESPFSDCRYLEKIVFEDTSADKEDYISLSWSKLPSVKGIYIKTIPTEKIMLLTYDLEDLPNLEKIYFAGSEEKWNELTYDNFREELDRRDIEVEFYYRHSHSFKQSGKATCIKGGTYTYTCECGDSYKQSIDKNQVKHKYSAWKITKEATYTAAGTKQRTCSVCKKVETKTVAKLKLYTGSNYKPSATDRTENSITLSWDAVKGATGYRVYLYDRETGKDSKIASVKEKTTYTVKGLEKGYSYIFKVQPYHKDSKGNVVFGEKTNAYAETLATAPTNLVAVSEETGKVKLTWESSGEWVAYNIDYHTSKEDLIAGKTLEYPYYNRNESTTIKNLESGKTYYFQIKIDFDTVDGVKTSEIVEVTVK